MKNRNVRCCFPALTKQGSCCSLHGQQHGRGVGHKAMLIEQQTHLYTGGNPMKQHTLIRGFMRHLFLVFCIVCFSMLYSSALARPFRIGKIPDKGKGFGCGTCHINPRGGGARNSFGSDYEKIAIKAGEKYTEDLGKRDSDGDGFDNDREFEAGTNPGDDKSKP